MVAIGDPITYAVAHAGFHIPSPAVERRFRVSAGSYSTIIKVSYMFRLRCENFISHSHKITFLPYFLETFASHIYTNLKSFTTLKAMRNRRAAGVCGIPPEIVEAEVTRMPTKQSNVILEEQGVPDD